jgi:hypothetical protein
MLRALAAFAAIVALIAQGGGMGAHAAVRSVPQVTAVVTFIGSPGTADHHGDCCVPHQPHCCQASCSIAFALGAAGASFQIGPRGSDAFDWGDRCLLSLPFKRDPPIPRSPT